jgi:hypothetical protein
MENETVNYDLEQNNELPEFFDWKIYLIMNIDLIESGIISEQAATEHYLMYGKDECRQYFENHNINNFVYCGGKCASETLYKTFLNNKRRTYKAHSYNESRFKDNFKYPIQLIENNSKKNGPIYIIDSYRNPIERKMSSFFYNNYDTIKDISFDDVSHIFNDQYIINNYTVIINFKFEKKNDLLNLIEKFSENLILDEEHNTYLKITFKTNERMEFFCKIIDRHADYFGVCQCKKLYINNNNYYHSIDEIFRHYDISESFMNFDFEKKYGMYKHENIIFIKLRFCDINNWDKILESLFDTKFNMYNDNLSDNMPYIEQYNEFKKIYKIPRSFLKELLKDEHFNAYNTIEERRKYIKYWMDRSY